MKENESTLGELIGKQELARRIGAKSTKLVDSLVQRRLIPVLRFGHRTVRYDWTKVQESLSRLEVAAVE